tara:strand:+ start:9296 stop:10279 length:984 start_codon:yes stop_codon:yes gene_type:complete
MNITNKSDIFCGNCGKQGHMFKSCKEPIISIGLIAFNINSTCLDPADTLRLISNKSCKKHELQDFFYNGIKKNYIKPIKPTADSIKFLMIRRKNTLGYMEFMRGRYSPTNPASLQRIIKLMIQEEIDNLLKEDFDNLWNSLWMNRSKHNFNEFRLSKARFITVKNNGILDSVCKTTKPLFKFPEWGFPKGRRHLQETDIECGLREFSEETGYNKNEVQILNKLQPNSELFKGTNNIPYKHVYFTSCCLFANKSTVDNKNMEIGDMGWFTLKEAIPLIRDRHDQRKKILIEQHQMILRWLQQGKILDKDENEHEANNEDGKKNYIEKE